MDDSEMENALENTATTNTPVPRAASELPFHAKAWKAPDIRR